MSKVSLAKVLIGLLVACLHQSSSPQKPYLGFRGPRTFVLSKDSLAKVLIGLSVACLHQSSSPQKPYLGFRGPRTFVLSKVSLAKVLIPKKTGMSYDIPGYFFTTLFSCRQFQGPLQHETPVPPAFFSHILLFPAERFHGFYHQVR